MSAYHVRGNRKWGTEGGIEGYIDSHSEKPEKGSNREILIFSLTKRCHPLNFLRLGRR